jgi:hypothetical protein
MGMPQLPFLHAGPFDSLGLYSLYLYAGAHRKNCQRNFSDRMPGF